MGVYQDLCSWGMSYRFLLLISFQGCQLGLHRDICWLHSYVLATTYFAPKYS